MILKNNHPKMAALSGLLRLIYSFILTYAVIQLIKPLTTENAIEAFSTIESFESIWSFGLILFGFHLVFTGLASMNYSPKTISILLVFAGLSYVLVHSLDTFTNVDITTLTTILMLPMTIGELGFGAWLLFKGK
jgi:hypothetical protein